MTTPTPKIKLVLKSAIAPVSETKASTLQCNKCSVSKDLSEFYARYKICKECVKTSQRERNQVAKTKQVTRYADTSTTKTCKQCGTTKPISAFRINRAKCHDCEKQYGVEYNKTHQDIREKWLENNKDRVKELQANWYQRNKSHVREKYKARYHSDAEFKLNSLVRKRILYAIKTTDKSEKPLAYLGTDANTVCNWLEYCFNDNMTWDNHGTYWHIDHVIPTSLHDCKDATQVKLVFSWMNLMPITAEQNMTKKNTLDPDQIAVHIQNLRDFISVAEIEEKPDEYIKFTETISETP